MDREPKTKLLYPINFRAELPDDMGVLLSVKDRDGRFLVSEANKRHETYFLVFPYVHFENTHSKWWAIKIFQIICDWFNPKIYTIEYYAHP